MATADVIEPARTPALGDFPRVEQRAAEVDEDGLGDGGVEVGRLGPAALERQLQYREKPRRGEGDVETHARPVHVGAVEGRVPGEHGAGGAEHEGRAEVGVAAPGLAVEGRVLGGHDAGGDEERDSRVVHAGEALHKRLVRDAGHGVPHGAADEALAGGEEEAAGDEDVELGGGAEGGRAGVEVEGEGEDDEEADGVRPDVDELVGDPEAGFDAVELGLGEAVSACDVRVHSPRFREMLVGDKAMLSCLYDRKLDLVF